MKYVYIKTYGCQMNMYDSDRMVALLKPLGYGVTPNPDDADLMILNTCHIREKAAEKMYSDLGRLNPVKQEKKAAGKDVLIAVAGCTAQAEGGEIMKRAKYVDMVFGPQSYHQLPQMIAEASRRRDLEKQGKPVSGLGILNVEFPDEPKFDSLPDAIDPAGFSAFLAIQEGCDKFCHFCIVPYTRGAEYSRPVQAITDEARHLTARGVREITLLGQNVNAYHGASADGTEWNLAKLLRHLAANVPGLDRIRYTTSHPRDVDDDLIAVHGDLPQLMPYLHLPVQSGSDRILKSMNRRHTRDFYIDIMNKFRAVRPDIAFSSDFIVGYPGETEADFDETLKLVQTIGYAGSYSFKYSPRPGTPAGVMDDQIPEHIKDERLQRLQAAIRHNQETFNASMIGKTISVLFEKKGRHDGQLGGRSPYLQAVHADAPMRLLGQIVPVKITGSSVNSLTGHVELGQTD